jgi:hypothetical protein
VRAGADIADLAEDPGARHVTKARKLVMIAAPGYSRNEAVRNRPSTWVLVTAPCRRMGRRWPGQMPYGDGTTASFGAAAPCHGFPKK